MPLTLHPKWTQARARGVALHLQHPGMQRRARNSSCANRRERRLRWHVEWRFPAAGFTAADKCACMPGASGQRGCWELGIVWNTLTQQAAVAV